MKCIFSGFLFILIAVILMGILMYMGYTTPGFIIAGIMCGILVIMTVYHRYTSGMEEKILKTGLIQQYLLSNFTIDQSALNYIQKLLKEDYNITVPPSQLRSVIEKEQTQRELELEREELADFKNKFFIDNRAPQTLQDYIKQFVTVFGRGSMRNIYYLKKMLDEASISFSTEKEFTDRIVSLKNLIEKEIQHRGGSARKEEQVTVKVCPTCGNEYPGVLLFCPFCEKETERISEYQKDTVYCPRCNKPMVRSILKRDGTFVKGYQCRNLKCLYEITDEESNNSQ